MGNLIDLTGKTFKRLKVLEMAKEESAACGYPAWKCQCECGKTVIVLGANLRSGATRSCGCLRNDTNRKIGALRAARNRQENGKERSHVTLQRD